MFSDNNSIIVVDDDRESLERIARVFNGHGIGCKLIETDGMNDLPKTPLKGVKIAFFDISFNNQGDENAMFATLKDIIKTIISRDNGPFVLVFWTTNKDEIDKFIEFVNRDEHSNDLANPISIIPLEKTAFNDETLPNAIEQIYSDPLVKCLFSFTEQLKEASDNCINEISSLIPQDEKWGESSVFSQHFKDLFAKIAIKTLGMTNGIQFPDKAIKESLVPVFYYSLCTNDEKCWEEYLNMGSYSKSKLNKIDIQYIIPYLNSIYHIDKNVSDVTGRGIVRLFNDDEDCFTSRIHFNKQEWLNKRFLKNKFDFKYSYELVAIEYSAACDYANNKNRLRKYLMGVLCSEGDYRRLIEQKRDPNNGIPENVYPLDFVFSYNNDVKGMLLDLNSTLSEEEGDVFGVLGEPLFQFKHELMNKITEMHANHESRIGYSYF